MQCIAISVLGKESLAESYLIAATRAQLHVFRLKDHTFQSSWPITDEQVLDKENGAYESPTKRRRLSSHNISNPLAIPLKATSLENSPPIILLVTSRTGRFVVSVTGDDKCVRTFALDDAGVLALLRERYCLNSTSKNSH